MTPARVMEEWGNRYIDNAVLWVQEVLGADPDPWQIEGLTAYQNRERNLSIRSGHGVGKTSFLAWTILHQLTFRYPQKTIVTAPSSPQLFDVLRPEVEKWLLQMPEPLRALYTTLEESIELRSNPKLSFVSFRTARAETPESIAGQHQDNTLFIGDEASGIAESVLETAIGSMTGQNAQTLLTGNPVRTRGLFFDTHHRLREKWHTIHVSCLDSPRVDPAYIEEVIARYGVDSNQYRVRVLGEFPKSDEDSVIPYEWISAALDRDVAPFQVRPIWGLDVARKGSDSCALAIRVGNSLKSPVETWKGYDLMETAGRILDKWQHTLPSERPSEINVDAIGLGGGVADRLMHAGLPVRSINVSESSTIKDRYANLRTELWIRGREWFEKKDCNICGDEELALELSETQFDKPTANGQAKVKSKDEMQKLGYASPNRADAFLLTLASESMQLQPGNDRSWNQPLKRNLAMC